MLMNLYFNYNIKNENKQYLKLLKMKRYKKLRR